MLLSPSEPGNAIVFGLSLSRLVLALAFLSAFLFFAGLFFKAARSPDWAEQILEQWFGGGRFSKWLAWAAGIGLGVGWIGCFLPSYRAGILGPHWQRIQPLMVFILLTSIATLAVFLVQRMEFSSFRLNSTFVLAFILFVVGLLVLGWMFYSKYGIYAPAEDFWYGAGVPILVSQVLLSLLGGVLFLLAGWNWNSGRRELLVVLLLYFLTAILWAREPLQKSFLFTAPRPPNGDLYPFADAAAFDAGSQFALIGQGIFIFGNPFTDRPLYLSYLVFLHSLFGQDYELLMAAQAAVFAVLPVIVYLIGRSLNMRSVGFAAALVTMFRGINAIAASSLIDLASPKMILSDFPAAIGVALIILATCEWLKRSETKSYYAVWVGGAIGLTLMIRPHALMFLVLIPVYALFKFGLQWKKWLFACALIGLGVLAVTLPWELRNVARGGIMYRSLVIKIEDVIRSRYTPVSPQGNIVPEKNILSAVMYQQVGVISSLDRHPRVVQETNCSSLLCFAPKHFLHNTMMSLLFFPTSPVFDDVWHTVKQAHSYWRADWNGSIAGTSLLFIAVNLFIIVLGISLVWKHQRFSGLFPLAAFAIYNLTNSLARTSGGRYIVPVDWILALYFMAGMLFLIAEVARIANIRKLPIFESGFAETVKTKTSASNWRKIGLAFIILFAIGSLVPLSEVLNSPRYAGFDIPGILQQNKTQIEKAGLSPEQLNAFLKTPGAEALVGRTLYPRSYKMGQGEVSFYFYPFTIMDFPRTGFFLIGPHGQDNIILPGGSPAYFPQATDALVVGCREQNYVDALMVVLLDQSGTIYTRSPKPELACPMKLPVCDNNSSCK